ncbi:MAG: hypothetical protein RLZZ450_6642 [Pseudomonadota bacterium]|jgi:hypothetical protein
MASASVEGGNVIVTAYGSDASHCKVLRWTESAADVLAEVRCFDATGSAADSAFTLSYTDKTVPTPHGWGAYAWADQSATAAYTPNAFYSEWAAASVGRIAEAQSFPVGIYTLLYPYQVPFEGDGKSATHVTAYGPGSAYCKVASWEAPDVTVKTLCFSGTGTPINSQYVNRFLYSSLRSL